MLKYLIIVIDKVSPSYCHYSASNADSQLMSIDNLKKAIRFAMIENLNVQYVLPSNELPKEYLDLIDEFKGSKIAGCNVKVDADVLVVDDPYKLPTEIKVNVPYVIRVCKESFKDTYESILDFASKVLKVNVVFTDVHKFDANALTQYSAILDHATEITKGKFVLGQTPQISIITDRILLDEMNNCNAGWESIAFCPDGKFYVCPAFYYESNGYSIGDLDTGLDIKNPQLYRLDHAPLCRDCDAFQCKRCIWLNQKLTREVGIPSEQQCKMAHLERNVSRNLLLGIKHINSFLKDKDIPAIDYLDPFEVKLKKDR